MYRHFIIFVLFNIFVSCGPATKTMDHITNHEISVTLDPENHLIKGTDQITAKLPAGRTEIGFLLNSSIEKVELVDSPDFTLTKMDISKFTTHYHKKIDLDKNAPLNYYVVKVVQPDSIIKFTVSYNGVIYDSLRNLKQEYSRGFSTTTGLIEQRGVYLSGSSGWIPTQKQGTFTFKLKTYLPLGWQSISQGEETSRGAEGDYQINEWTCNKPMEEVYLIAGKYLVTEEDYHGIKVMTYTYQDDPELAQNYRQATKRYLDLYNQQIGRYPYKKFALVENFWQTGYGMPSFTLLGSQVIRLPFIIHTSYGHEILHNWWGNGVYVDWERGNWCEGLTNYMADHYYKQLADKAVAYRRSMLQSYLNYVQNERDFPLTEFKERHNPATQAVGYGKASMVFHMLYKMLGEKKFLAAVKSFYKNYLFKTASWLDLEKEFTAQTEGQDLSWFFDQWINRVGAPILKLENATAIAHDSKFDVTITLSQSTPPYHLIVPVRFIGDSDTTVTAFMQQAQESYTFRLPYKPEKVWVDPEFDLFRKLDRAEIPPALSQTLGALQTVIILPTAANQEIYQAYQKMAEQWRSSDGVTIKSDKEVTMQDLKGKAAWIMGTMNKWFPKFSDLLPKEAEITTTEWRINNQKFPSENHSLVLTARHPDDPQLSWTLVSISNINDFPAISRKLPHYGKYGYLIFKGAQNVLKGEWVIVESPLIKEIILTDSDQAKE